MSHQLELTITSGPLPAVHAWNDAIRATGYDLQLEDFAWESHSGYLPAIMLGRPTGFELFVEQRPGGPADIAFALHSRADELVAAEAARDALMQLVEAIPGYEGQTGSVEEAVAGARESYARWLFLLARVDAGDEGLPPDQPGLWAPHEDAEMRQRIVDGLRDSREVRDGSRPGSLRLSKRAREELEELPR